MKNFLLTALLFIALPVHAQTLQLNGSPPQVATNIVVDGVPKVYNHSGLVPYTTSPKIWVDTVTSDTSGNWTADISSASFGSAPIVTATPISTGTGVQASFTAIVLTKTATSISGKIQTPMAVVVGGLPQQLANVATTVNVIAIGW